MATKTAKKPAKKGATGKVIKASKPTTRTVSKPTISKAKTKPATGKITKPETSKNTKTSGSQIAKAPGFRGARHEKPGTGRVDRTPSDSRPSTGTKTKAAGRNAASFTVTDIGNAAKVAATGSPFSRDELKVWRQTLLGHRSEIAQDIQHLEHDAMEAEDGHTTPNHIAERGSDAEMQDMSLGLAGQEQIVLWQIDRALRKIDSGIPAAFGICEHTGTPIPKTRLQLIPWTPVSIEGMNYVEENGLTIEDILVDG